MLALEPSRSCPSNGAAGPGVSAPPPQFVVPGLIWIVSEPNGGRPTVGPVQTSAIVVVVVGGAVVPVVLVVGVVVVVFAGAGWICALPEKAIAPGPGRSATPSTAVLCVAGMQNVAARADGCG